MAAAEKQTGWAGLGGRVIIEGVAPEIDCGRFPIKRVVGEDVVVEADVFMEGHESLACAVLYRRRGTRRWSEVAMLPLVNDRWRAAFPITQLGRYQYTILAWPDPFQSWLRDLRKRIDAAQDIRVDLRIGADLIDAARAKAPARHAAQLATYAQSMRAPNDEAARTAALSPQLAALMAAHAPRDQGTRFERELEVIADPVRATFSTWYELFPRSTSSQPGKHGTLRDVITWLPRLAGLGFDVLYLAPIHPIGRSFRKGRNNTLEPEPGDVGSPWAMGGPEGGHKEIHPELGTLADFRQLMDAAHAHGLEIALDVAFQASPDHPYVRNHAEWFRKRPDGTMQYAENPPKKYQDIYPFDFESSDAAALRSELRSIFSFWIEQGVRIFRVDNPHTKPFAFWEWVLGTLKQKHPDLIFLSEAFTRPRVMYRLAKLGFTQSYTYFAWRNSKWEIMEYFRELTAPPVADFFRPNLWPNTPDILTEPFQQHGEPVFKSRLILAATLGASYGIYGPPYEKMINVAREPGSEEYLDSEKYELKHWDFAEATPVSTLIASVNNIRRENPALQSNRNLIFHPIDNDQLLAYSKHTADLSNVIITVVNLDPYTRQSGWLELPLEALALTADQPFTVKDLLTGAEYAWRGAANYVELDPHHLPAHVLRVVRARPTAHD